MEYQLDDKFLFNYFINERLFNNEKKKKLDPTAPDEPARESLELIIRPECNQKCDYCYIGQYGDTLYPFKERLSKDKIIKNVKILFEYFLQRQCYFQQIELFAGDMFYDDLFFDLMETLYNVYFKPLKENDNVLFHNGGHPTIIIPCNFSFCNNVEQYHRVEQLVDKFSDLRIDIGFSWSHDGRYAYDVREKTIPTTEFYDRAFHFVRKYNAGIHGMISVECLDNAIENLKWWEEIYEKELPERKELGPYFLEVRNGKKYWTTEAIEKYLKLLDYTIEHIYDLNHRDPMAYIISVYCCRDQKSKRLELKNKYPHMCDKELPQNFTELIAFPRDGETLSCTLGHAICINVATLSFVPCHRLNYEQFRGGRLVIDKFNKNTDNIKFNDYINNKLTEKITDIEHLPGLNGYLSAYYTIKYRQPGCATCDYKELCVGGCLGAQFENSGDLNLPIQSVCNLFKSKIDFIFKKYKELGILDIMMNSEITPLDPFTYNTFKIFLERKKWYNE